MRALSVAISLALALSLSCGNDDQAELRASRSDIESFSLENLQVPEGFEATPGAHREPGDAIGRERLVDGYALRFVKGDVSLHVEIQDYGDEETIKGIWSNYRESKARIREDARARTGVSSELVSVDADIGDEFEFECYPAGQVALEFHRSGILGMIGVFDRAADSAQACETWEDVAVSLAEQLDSRIIASVP